MKRYFFTTREEQCSFTGEIYSYDVIISERKLAIWRLEYWWIFLNKPTYHPTYRTHLFGRWFWRESYKSMTKKEKIKSTSNKLGI
jgi:hypothetical protein